MQGSGVRGAARLDEPEDDWLVRRIMILHITILSIFRRAAEVNDLAHNCATLTH